MTKPEDLPAVRDWSAAAIKLLQGVVYSDEEQAWDAIMRNPSSLADHFATIGLQLVIDEPEGFAFLRQFDADEDGDLPDGYTDLPKLFRRTRLTYEATLLCVMLREELRRFEEEEVHNERCVINGTELLEQWKTFFVNDDDEVRLKRSLDASLKKLDDLKFIHRFGKSADEWEIRRILKARLSAAALERLKDDLTAARDRRQQ